MAIIIKKAITIIVTVYYCQQQFTYLIRVGIKGETALIQLHIQFSKRKSQRRILIVYRTVTPSGFAQPMKIELIYYNNSFPNFMDFTKAKCNQHCKANT